MQRHEAIARILQHREQLEGLGVESLTLFGSVARNEATNENDIDLLVDFNCPVGVFRFSKIRLLLGDVLGCSVDRFGHKKFFAKSFKGNCIEGLNSCLLEVGRKGLLQKEASNE